MFRAAVAVAVVLGVLTAVLGQTWLYVLDALVVVLAIVAGLALRSFLGVDSRD